MATIRDHELRYALANELHARPFPEIPGPCRAIYLALTLPEGQVAARADLEALLDRLERRLWLAVFGVVSVILAQGINDIIQMSSGG